MLRLRTLDIGLLGGVFGALLSVIGISPARSADGEGQIVESVWQAESFPSIARGFRAELPDGFRYALATADSDLEVLRRVHADPRFVGFVQRDLFAERVRENPEEFGRIEFYGEIPACLVVAVRKGSRIATFEDFIDARDGRRVTLDVGPDGGRGAATFALLSDTDPTLANLKLEHRGSARALSRVAAGDTDAALLIEYAPYRNPDLDGLLARGEVELASFIPPGALATSSGGAARYRAREIRIGGGNWIERGSAYQAICTSLGVAVSEKTSADLSEAVAHAVLAGAAEKSGGFSIDGVLGAIAAVLHELGRLAASLADAVSGWLFGAPGHSTPDLGAGPVEASVDRGQPIAKTDLWGTPDLEPRPARPTIRLPIANGS